MSESASTPPLFTVAAIPTETDVTVFLHDDPNATEEQRRQYAEWVAYLGAASRTAEGTSGYFSDGSDRVRFSAAEELRFRRGDKGNREYQARGLACFAARRESISFTLRDIGERSTPTPPSMPGADPVEAGKPTSPLAPGQAGVALVGTTGAGDKLDTKGDELDAAKDFKYKAFQTYKDDSAEYWFSIDDQCNALYEKILDDNQDNLHGLIVLCGATKSSKSLIARGLIHLVLEKLLERRRKEPGRRPHFVTFEDPIEKFLISSKRLTHLPKIAQAALWGVDYTPREKGRDKDVPNLKQAFADALRQTPAIFYIGEVRDRTDWADVLEFAGTGHLVVTTAHAGSLLEMMMKILSAVGADIPAKRRLYAGKLLSVIHLKSFGAVAAGRELLLPSVWRRTEQGLAALTASGFAGIVPAESADNDGSCYGRHALLKLLLSKLKKGRKGAMVPDSNQEAQLKRLARSDDL